jgi:hypothetical protein
MAAFQQQGSVTLRCYTINGDNPDSIISPSSGEICLCVNETGGTAGVWQFQGDTWVQIGGSGMLSKTITLTSDQILNSNTSPVTLIDAPGAGKQINLLSVQGFYDYGTANYSGTDNSAGLIQGDTTYLLETTIGKVLQSASSDSQFKDVLGNENGGNTGISLYNQPIQFYTQGSNPSDGDGSVTITLVYAITN